MSALAEFLFPSPAPRSAPDIVRWWERRRLVYNAAVGTAGTFSILAVNVLMRLPPHPIHLHPIVPWQGVLAFGLVANLCYFLGPTVEIAAHKLWGRSVLPTGPALFRMGLTFSVGLALLPTLVAILVFVARVVGVLA